MAVSGTADWIAVDWGTSNLRAWAMGAGETPLTMLSSPKGMGSLARDDFEPALLALVEPVLKPGVTTQVICCGMVGARQGWFEAGYSAVPCKAPGGDAAVQVPDTDARLDVRILPGVRQDKPADVMRGEETQIAGILHDDPRFDGVLCLPGTHTKWAHISAQEIVSFQTFMTGEMFALLSSQSVLRHSVQSDDWDEAAFADAVDQAMTRPQSIAARLFGLRAESLLSGLSAASARARLSGFLLGLELAGARPYWLGQRIMLIGDGRLSNLYKSALATQGAMAEVADGDRTVLRGLVAARAALKPAG